MTKSARQTIPTVLIIGALWGIFEATVGYALHLLPWRIGSYIWFPAAYFFMDRVYRATGRRWAVVATALVSAAIKLINLIAPVRVDYVLNPAVSIMLESLSMIGVLSVAALKDKRAMGSLAAKVLAVNTLWRLAYTLYLTLLVPTWMREASVIRSAEAYLPFILRENMISSIVCVLLVCIYGLLEKKASRLRIIDPTGRARYAAAGVLLGCGVLVQFALLWQ